MHPDSEWNRRRKVTCIIAKRVTETVEFIVHETNRLKCSSHNYVALNETEQKKDRYYLKLIIKVNKLL